MRGIFSQRPVTRSLGVFFDMLLNKRLSKKSRLLWFETNRAHYDFIVIIGSDKDTPPVEIHPLYKQMLTVYDWTIANIFQCKLNQNKAMFKEMSVKMWTKWLQILSRPQCAKIGPHGVRLTQSQNRSLQVFECCTFGNYYIYFIIYMYHDI